MIFSLQVNEFARVILGKALQLIIQLEENTPAGATLERMSNQVSKEITVFDAFTDLNSNAIRKVRSERSPPRLHPPNVAPRPRLH